MIQERVCEVIATLPHLRKYEKRAVNYRAMVVLASIVIWLES